MNDYRRLLPYGVAIGTTAIALLLTLWVQAIISGPIAALFYIAIAISTWYGGRQSGIVTIVLSTLALKYYFIPPIHQIQLSNFDDVLRLFIFLAVALIINLLSANLQESKRKVEQLNRRLTEESAERLQIALNEAQRSQALLQQQFQQQRLIMEISQRIRRSLNLQEILQTTVDEVRQFLHTDRVIIFQYFQDRHGIVAVESCGANWTAILSTEIYDPCFGQNYVEPFTQGLITAKSDIYTAGIDECHLQLLSNFQVRANLVVPIIKGDELWGLLIAHHCAAPRQWQNWEIDLLRQIASQVSIALQQSELFEQVQTKLVERQQAEAERIQLLQKEQAAREEAENLLRQLEIERSRLEQILQQMPVGVLISEAPSGKLRFYNQEAVRLLGHPLLKSATEGEYIQYGAIHADGQPYQAQEYPLAHSLRSGAVVKAQEMYYRQGDGTITLLSVSAAPILDQEGQIIAAVSIFEDISDRKQAEQSLGESEARLRLAQIASNSAVWDWDILANTYFWSPEYYQLYGLDPSTEANYQNWLCCVHPEDRERANQQILQALEDGSSELRVEFRVMRSDEIRWFAGIGQVLRDGAGEPIRMIGITIDITEQKQTEIALQQLNDELEHRVTERTAELTALNDRLLTAYKEQAQTQESLRESEERRRLALDLTHIGFWDCHIPSGKIIWNDNHFTLLGLTPDCCEPTYELWYSHVHPNDLGWVVQQFSDSLKNQTDYTAEHRVIHPDGSIHWVMARARAIYDQTGQPLRSLGVLLDITDRKQAEQRLALQAVIARNMAEGVCLVKADDATIVYANPKFEQMFGYEPGEINGQHVSIVNYATESVTAEEVNQSIRSAVLEKGEATYEVYNVKKDGTPFWCSATCSVFQHPEYGDVLVAVHQDISDRKEAEAALQQQTRQEQLRWSITQAIRQSLDLYAILNSAAEQIRHTLQVDRVAVYRFGSDWSGDFIAESVSDDWVKLLKPDVQKVWEDTYLQETQGGRFQNHEIFVIPNIYTAGLQPCHIKLLEQFQAKAYAVVPIFSGEILWGLLAIYQNANSRDWQAWEIELLQQIASQLSIALQQSQLYSQLHLELQERKQAEAVLREAERRWRSLLENVQLIVIGLDIDGKVEYANPFFLKLTGYKLEEVLGKCWFDHFLHPSQKSSAKLVFEEILIHNLHPHYQNPILTKVGEERIIAWSNTVLQNTSGLAIGMISIGEDITQRYKVDRMKAEFISVVSHELRTPLTSMQAALSLLNDKIIDPLSEEGEATIQIATEGTDRLVRLVNDILDLERLESGKVRLEKHLHPVDDLVNTAIAQMQEMANQAGIALEANPCHFQAKLDGDRLIQVLTNLLSNAIKFSPNNSVVRLSVEQKHSEETPSFLLFTVCDRGRGIPADKLESIFDRFHQVDASDSREKGGTGLGLAISRNIVQQHGGEIWAESTMGEGSIFYFTIPMGREGHHVEITSGNNHVKACSDHR